MHDLEDHACSTICNFSATVSATSAEDSAGFQPPVLFFTCSRKLTYKIEEVSRFPETLIFILQDRRLCSATSQHKAALTPILLLSCVRRTP